MRHWPIYIAAAIATLVIVVISQYPAVSAWASFGEPRIASKQTLAVSGVDGTIWEGNAYISWRRQFHTRLDWELSPIALLGLTASGDIDAKDPSPARLHRLYGEVAASPIEAETDLRGFVSADLINVLLGPRGIRVNGSVDINSLFIATDYTWFTGLAGKISWAGGQISIERPQRRLALPALEGNLTLEADVVKLDVTHGVESVMEIELRRSGWALINIRNRMLGLAALPPVGDGQPDTVAVTLEEQVFPGR